MLIENSHAALHHYVWLNHTTTRGHQQMRQALRLVGLLARVHSFPKALSRGAAAARPSERPPCWRRGGRREQLQACSAVLSGPRSRSSTVAAGPGHGGALLVARPLGGKRRTASACGASVRVPQPLCERDATHEVRFCFRCHTRALFYRSHELFLASWAVQARLTLTASPYPPGLFLRPDRLGGRRKGGDPQYRVRAAA